MKIKWINEYKVLRIVSFRGIRPTLVASYLQDQCSTYLKMNNSPLMQGGQNRIFLFLVYFFGN